MCRYQIFTLGLKRFKKKKITNAACHDFHFMIIVLKKKILINKMIALYVKSWKKKKKGGKLQLHSLKLCKFSFETHFDSASAGLNSTILIICLK